MSCAAAKLGDDLQTPAAQRLGLREPVGGLQYCRQVVEADGDAGMLRPVAFLSIASARRINGSASANRLVACNNATIIP